MSPSAVDRSSGDPTPEVVLQDAERYGDLRASEIRDWLRDLVAELEPSAESLGVRFVDDEAMREMNLRYRDRDATTDVLSFPGDATLEGRHVGDILISVPAARRQAATRAHDAEREIRLLLLHGLLHCMGMDHEKDDGEMARVEALLRERWVP